MLVVVLIIAVLAAIAFPQYQLAVLKSRYTQLMVMADAIRQAQDVYYLADAIRQAQDVYYLAHGKYSLKINDLDITIPGDCTLTNNGGIIACPKFRCAVNDGAPFAETLGSAYCTMRIDGSKRIYYMTSSLRRNTKRKCAVSSANDLGKKVCESFGGRLDTIGGNNGLWYYKL